METSFLVQAENEVTVEQEKEFILSIVKKVQENPNISMVTEQVTISKREALEALVEERDHFLQICEEKDSYIDTLHKDISWLMEDSIRREFEVEVCTKLDAEKAFK